jgi:hypothetical protein
MLTSGLKWLLRVPDSLPFLSNALLLTAAPAISPAASVSLSSPEAILAIYGPVATGLKRYRGLFPAGGTRDRRAL